MEQKMHFKTSGESTMHIEVNILLNLNSYLEQIFPKWVKTVIIKNKFTLDNIYPIKCDYMWIENILIILNLIKN